MDRRVLLAALGLAGLGVVAPLLPSYPLTLLTQALVSAIFAMSLDLLLGYTGLPSMGHAAYFGVAAYTVAILAVEAKVGFFACVLAALFAAPIRMLLGSRRIWIVLCPRFSGFQEACDIL